MFIRIASITTIFLFILVSSSVAKITVKSVKGKVSFKKGRVWKPLQSGMSLKEGTKISTGIRGRAVVKLNGHVMRIRPLTMIKLYENKSTTGRSSTRIGLRRGSIRAKINRRRNVRTVFKISTPVATSSVRGTEEEVSYGPGKGMQVDVIEGRIEAETINGTRKFVQGRSKFKFGTDGTKPDSLVGDLADGSKNPLGDPNIIEDEKDGLAASGNDGIGGVDDPATGLPTRTRVNVTIDWPE